MSEQLDTVRGRVLCFGSVNIDHVYNVDKLVKEGETKSATSFQTFAGGKEKSNIFSFIYFYSFTSKYNTWSIEQFVLLFFSI